MLSAVGPGVTVGPSILGLVTSGIYNDPLSIYREYIQNSVDELARVGGVGGNVDITIDPRQRKVSICDNGTGLTYQECLDDLVPISQSKKCIKRDRGFRGFGRLSGLSFAESVTFLTRASGRDPVTRVAWSKTTQAGHPNAIQTTEHGFHDWVRVDTLDPGNYPEHFFRVEVSGISRHAAGTVLNRETVRNYIGEVCPVPFAPDFPFVENVQAIFPPEQSPYSLRITLNGEEQPVQRQYGPVISLSGNREDQFQEFEEIRVPSIDGKQQAAVGWIAHSSYLGAISKGNRIRGIRVRVGNIEVGDERVFDHLFEEERFNRWCVGELHVLDSRIVPNGRRDYFEQTPHLRNLENHLAPVFRNITGRCRKASSNRNKEKRLLSVIADLEDLYELAASGCLAPDDAQAIVESGLQQAEEIHHKMCPEENGNGSTGGLGTVEDKLLHFRPNDIAFPLASVTAAEVGFYRRVFEAVAATAPSARAAREIIDAILKESRC